MDRKNADFRICIDCNEAERLKIKEKKTATQLPTVIYVCPSLRHLFTFKNAREYNPIPAGGLYISLHNSFLFLLPRNLVLFYFSCPVLYCHEGLLAINLPLLIIISLNYYLLIKAGVAQTVRNNKVNEGVTEEKM